MKNFKLILALCALMIGTTLIATNPPTNEDVKSKMTEQINEMFENSDFELPKNVVETNVTFTLNKANKIIVIDVDCDCEDVAEFVKYKLNNEKLKVETVTRGNIYKLPLKLVKS